jgi:hypothetical protein
MTPEALGAGIFVAAVVFIVLAVFGIENREE